MLDDFIAWVTGNLLWLLFWAVFSRFLWPLVKILWFCLSVQENQSDMFICTKKLRSIQLLLAKGICKLFFWKKLTAKPAKTNNVVNDLKFYIEVSFERTDKTGISAQE